jgi:peptide/nickel transport system substrate-binding protein
VEADERFLYTGTPLYNEEGGELLSSPRNFDTAKRLLAESGYAGEPVLTMAAQDIGTPQGLGRRHRRGAGAHRRQGRLRRAGLGHRGRAPGAEGAGRAGRLADLPYLFLRRRRCRSVVADHARQRRQGVLRVADLRAEVAAWFDARTPEEERAIAGKLNRLAFDHGLYAPLGQFLMFHAWRTSLAGVGQGPLPFFWGVSKTA